MTDPNVTKLIEIIDRLTSQGLPNSEGESQEALRKKIEDLENKLHLWRSALRNAATSCGIELRRTDEPAFIQLKICDAFVELRDDREKYKDRAISAENTHAELVTSVKSISWERHTWQERAEKAEALAKASREVASSLEKDRDEWRAALYVVAGEAQGADVMVQATPEQLKSIALAVLPVYLRERAGVPPLSPRTSSSTPGSKTDG